MAQTQKTDSLYDRDFYAWTQDQAGKLRTRATFDNRGDVDWEDVAEEIESVGRAEKRDAMQRCGNIVLHLLKWQVLTGFRSESVRCLVKVERLEVRELLSDSPSLHPLLSESLAREYGLSRLRFVAEAGLPMETTSLQCPFTIEEILDPDFYPEGLPS